MWRKKSKSKPLPADEAPATSSASNGPENHLLSAPPPAYGSESNTHPAPDPAAELTPAFGNLNLNTAPAGAQDKQPNEDTNGGGGGKAAAATATELNGDVLVKLREKRWAVYVGRAVDRYVAWWRSFVPDMLREKDMVDPDEERKDRFEGFTRSEPMVWNADMLPPLDVLLVWHAHMLNPRLYLEDCIRYGHGALWTGGMPWAVINKAIAGATFQYVVSSACTEQWKARTNLEWRNEDDADTRDVRCPACPATVTIPWTTCGQPQDYSGTKRPGIVGEGYGDGQLSYLCPACNLTITHDALRVAKFRNDIQFSIKSDWAMPGTILDLKTGIPKRLNLGDSNVGCPDQLFPTRLARRGLLVEVVEMLKPESATSPSMMAVRDVIEENFTGKFADAKNLREVMDRHGYKKVTDFRLGLEGRRQTRKMMSRYWENASPFAIDLVGCVMRQGMFTEKMCKLNWLHFPTARNLMTGILRKYDRFIEIVALATSTKDKVAVPTLDVDLAWHTHQLSPQHYFDYTVQKVEAFVDHNDRVDEDKLSTAFEWTTKTYQEKYGEVYSECKCWYCETIRVMALPAIKMFGMSKEEKLLEEWHASPRSKGVPIPPAAESTHVSSHPAVHTNETTGRSATVRPLRLEYQNRLEETHSKARKRATKTFKADGGKRMGPRGEDKTSFWGKDIAVDGPWASGLAAVSTSAMYPTPPGFVQRGTGAVGSCATGTCGGATGCGSEMLGMCFAGCVG
ncbi:Glycine-rich domain-containing protein 1-like protein 2 [Colletotrichum chlorophyti]|uniref:Glycine-rich domain-containing protein 1-like protein 2 n=1 Tax=Colletotrichum chlorophyti TaxID=708187 RepID=A0A1Q8S3U0_9PEZI|nr:Glycine-rich domain-containing protein 1-like protein 2 [Colletotrichum chlorophyti]